MSNRVWIDDRNYKILHNRYNDDGTVEQFWVYYKENSTKDTIYITEELDEKYAAEYDGGVGTSTSLWPGGVSKQANKKVVYEAKDGKTTPICKREVERTGEAYAIKYTRVDGTTFEKVYPCK